MHRDRHDVALGDCDLQSLDFMGSMINTGTEVPGEANLSSLHEDTTIKETISYQSGDLKAAKCAGDHSVTCDVNEVFTGVPTKDHTVVVPSIAVPTADDSIALLSGQEIVSESASQEMRLQCSTKCETETQYSKKASEQQSDHTLSQKTTMSDSRDQKNGIQLNFGTMSVVAAGGSTAASVVSDAEDPTDDDRKSEEDAMVAGVYGSMDSEQQTRKRTHREEMPSEEIRVERYAE
ncbi:hypothetical protein GN958_ATG23261 [Phytophthora infestans]|uniref:Uncharacterized protein n=2 Tax=Phytophthora infestans TaxID=4787 RepID=A0A8S9TJA4_PHYIN|nr:hypothetical protein GN958_ATG23261 [Phytophthora infestans]